MDEDELSDLDPLDDTERTMPVTDVGIPIVEDDEEEDDDFPVEPPGSNPDDPDDDDW
jgi:hypothetical protein